MVKGGNGDTVWCAVIDSQWAAFQVWLAPSNFDAKGFQRKRLGDVTQVARVADDPAP